MIPDAQKTDEQRRAEESAERMRKALATQPLHRQGMDNKANLERIMK